MRFLVTGGAGFMGSHLAEVLYRKGHAVAVADDFSGGSMANLEDCAPSDRHRWMVYRADLSLSADAERLVADWLPDVVCHLAANAREGASQFQPRDVTRRNLMAYMNVLVPAIRVGAKKVVLYSSMAVYGNQEPPFDESMPRHPIDVYGVNKAAMERVTEILAAVHRFQYTILRPHNVFGERQALGDPFRNVVGIFMNRIMRGEPLTIYGDGEQTRAFTYIDDVLEPMVRAAERTDARLDEQIINLGGRTEYTVNRLAELVCAAMGARPEIIHAADRPCEVKHAYCTWEKSARILGFQQTIGVEDGIALMARWAKAQRPQAWWNRDVELAGESLPEAWRQ